MSHAGQIAYQAHLAGTAMAFLYWQGGLNFTRLTDKFTSGKLFQRRPRLRVHRPTTTTPPEERPDRKEAARAAEMDRILAKLHQEGERKPDPQRTPHPSERESAIAREAAGLVGGRLDAPPAIDSLARRASRRLTLRSCSAVELPES